MFADTHCHILKEYYDNIDEVISNARDNHIDKIINNACNEESSYEVIELVKKYDSMYGAIGLHPENCMESFDFNLLYQKNDKIVAIGEIGLDYHYDVSSKLKQIEVFEKQLGIAEKLGMPVVVHSRDAYFDTIKSLRKYKVRGVIHSFSGTLDEALEYIKMGFLIGVNGIITFKNADIKEVIKNIGVENIILETDSPYLSPVPFRGKRNEPARIYDIALFVSNLFNISLEELAKITNQNMKRVFDI